MQFIKKAAIQRGGGISKGVETEAESFPGEALRSFSKVEIEIKTNTSIEAEAPTYI